MTPQMGGGVPTSIVRQMVFSYKSLFRLYQLENGRLALTAGRQIEQNL
jgi:hypothetical protein